MDDQWKTLYFLEHVGWYLSTMPVRLYLDLAVIIKIVIVHFQPNKVLDFLQKADVGNNLFLLVIHVVVVGITMLLMVGEQYVDRFDGCNA